MTVTLTLIYSVNILVIIGVGYFGYKTLAQNPLQQAFLPALAFKVVSGIMLGLVYFFYYKSGDTILYFENAKDLLLVPWSEYFNEVFLSPIPYDERSTLPIIKMTSLVLAFTGSNYWLASAYFSIFSFMGIFYFLNQLLKKYPSLKLSSTIAFLFFPSFVFWSSGILKESVVTGLLMFMTGIFMRYHHTGKLNVISILATLFFGWLMLVLKYYIAAVFLPILLMLFCISFFEKNNYWQKVGTKYQYMAIIMLGGILFFLASQLQYNLDFSRIFLIIKQNQQVILEAQGSGFIRFFDESQASWLLIPNIVLAMLSGLFRPIFPEVLSFPQVFVGLENLLIVCLFLTTLKNKWLMDVQNRKQVFVVTFYILVLASLLAYSSPNFGTLARLKVYYMPFFLMYCLHQSRILRRFETG